MMVKRRLSSTNRPPPAGNLNRLLAALPNDDYERIVPALEVVPLKVKHILHKPGEPIQDLMARDRMGRDDFPLTQEFVAMMLGATRPTVTVVAGTLQKAGLITYHRGHVTIVDRKRLEAASCECYRAATNLLQNVTSQSHGSGR